MKCLRKVCIGGKIFDFVFRHKISQMDESGNADMFIENENIQYDEMTRAQKIESVKGGIEDLSRGHILEGDAKDFRDFPAGNEKILKSFKQESDKIISELSKDDPVTTWWGSNPG